MAVKRGFGFYALLSTGRRYITADNGWTLASWELTPAEVITNYVNVPGRDGDLDLTTAQTDGVPKYKNRTLTINLECSEGTRADRLLKVKDVTRLTGYQYMIVSPDDQDPERYLLGRIISVKENYNDLAHTSVTITAVCEPYKYLSAHHTETLVGSTEEWFTVVNRGDKPVTVSFKVSGAAADASLYFDGYEVALTDGTYLYTWFTLQPGDNEIVLYGAATLDLSFQEVVLS